uniref:Uncharacterized protein n=1 Tax=Knipowitschia caucasica TaxID=637954 RepID=A0AAV2L908_KNICA
MEAGLGWISKLFVLTMLCLTLNADDDTKCEKEINVLRGVLYEAFNGGQLRLECPVPDFGLYACGFESEKSHYINVAVKDGKETFQDPNEKNSTSTDNKHVWQYLYCTVGIVGIVIVVTVISVLSMKQCNDKAKDKTEDENQYMDVPMVEQSAHHSSTTTSPRASPHKSSSAPSKTKRNQHRGRSVVYAALNHQQLASGSRPRTAPEEQTEYAAIKVS